MGQRKIMTAALRKALPKLYANESVKDPIVRGKFFTPDSSWTWFLLEFDGEDLLFTLAVSHFCPEGELGYSSLSELEAARGPLGLKIERDAHFVPKRLSEVRARIMATA